MVTTTLLLDCGNTRIKYKLGNEYGLCHNLSELEALLERSGVTHVVAADDAGRFPNILKLCTKRSIICDQCLVEDKFLGLTLVYRDVTTLGVDRWLAMLAARSLCGQSSVMVIDAGTAVKIDIINESGVHQGGAIAPGLGLSSRALFQQTDRLPEVDFEFNGELGTDTHGCIKYGIIMSVVALVERAMLQFPSSNVVLTGGDAKYLLPHLGFKVSHQPELVLAGLDIYSTEKRSQS